MSDYSQLTNFTAKDALATGNAEKIILGSDVDAEFSAISTAIASKEDSSNKSQASGYASLDGSALVPSQAEAGSGGELPFATETLGGVAELATTAEARALSNDTKIVTPLGVNDILTDNIGTLGQLHALSDPNDDRILFWDDSASAVTWLNPNGSLTISGTDIGVNDAAIDHDGLTNFVADEHVAHSTVSVTAGNGLTGGGTIAATRTVDVVGGEGLTANADDVALDIASLTQMAGSAVASTDEFLVYDASAAEHKTIPYNRAGFVSYSSSSAKTFDSAGINAVHELTGSTDRAFTLNTGVGEAGNWIGLVQTGTGSIQVDGTSTVNSANGLFTRTANSVAILWCLSTDVWVMFGDTATS